MNIWINGNSDYISGYCCVDNYHDAVVAIASHKRPTDRKIIRIENISFGEYDLDDYTFVGLLLWMEEKHKAYRWDFSGITFHIYTKRGFFRIRKMKRIINRNGWNLAED